MKTITYQKTITNPKLVITYDTDPESPREWSNLGYFITQDRNYRSPDNNETLQAIIKEGGEVCNSQEEHIAYIKKNYKDEKIIAIYPVVKYEHGGVSYSLGTIKGFDYSNNGFYIITDKKQKEMGTPKNKFEEVIKQELETYTQWANGEVYSFILYDNNGDIEDSCSGFYDIEEIREHLPEEWKDEKLSDYMKY